MKNALRQNASDSGRFFPCRSALAALVVAQLLWLPSVASAQGAEVKAPLPGYALVWSDEFDGTTLDAAKWTYRTDSKNLSTQKPENIVVKDGLLRLTLKKESANGKNYTGAGIISRPAFKHGYFEARIKMPAGDGWHNSFWLMKHDGSGTTDSQEASQGIDVAQNDSIDHQSYTVAVNKYNPLPTETLGYQRLPSPDLTAEFHVFGCEFTPVTAKFFLDGKLVQTVDIAKIPQGEMNLWVQLHRLSFGWHPEGGRFCLAPGSPVRLHPNLFKDRRHSVGQVRNENDH